ncbi:hypothetical protein [Planotetraspora kaengkrachanensis]|uniref:Uncharacterized protein n=1 Tax=Planotetraspora kaengkrachanensis TaxID=575193 RepID=A0A8J3LXN8_9ACTN|nr:hypothetical protein [Planotetraspora kaengkrachanensis]GIG80622.1 hypothetical protein Pka01_37490 [Planotetraspora kaengkrachanensis]
MDDSTDYADSAPLFPETTAAYVPPVGGGMGGFLDNLNSQMADAGTVYRSALDPSSVSDDELASAEERIDNAARNSSVLEGYTYQDQVYNDVIQHDREVQWSNQAHEAETDAWIEADRAE